jgi:hypothetical protein
MRKAMEAQIESLRAAFHGEAEEFERIVNGEKGRLGQVEHDREAMAQSRRIVARPKRNHH